MDCEIPMKLKLKTSEPSQLHTCGCGETFDSELRANVNLQGCQNKKHGEVDLDDEVGELVSKHCRGQTAKFKFLAMN